MTPSTKRIVNACLYAVVALATSAVQWPGLIHAGTTRNVIGWLPVALGIIGVAFHLASDDAPAMPPKLAETVGKVAVLAFVVVASGCTKVEIAGGTLVAVSVALVLAFLAWGRNRISHLAIVFALLAGSAHAQHAGPFYALAGDVLVMPPAPVEDPGRVAQVAEVNSPPAVPAPVPVAAVVSSTPPPVALNPLAPLVPPACTPTGKPFPVWLTVTLAIVGATVSTLEALHSAGVVGK